MEKTIEEIKELEEQCLQHLNNIKRIEDKYHEDCAKEGIQKESKEKRIENLKRLHVDNPD